MLVDFLSQPFSWLSLIPVILVSLLAPSLLFSFDILSKPVSPTGRKAGQQQQQKESSPNTSTAIANKSASEPVDLPNHAVKPSQSLAEEPMEWYKYMYHCLHNLEKYPDVLPDAKSMLFTMMAECIQHAQTQPDGPTILDVETYTPEALADFMQGVHDRICEQWDGYIARRDKGGEREMLKTREDAIHWLQDIAPSKCVDGAWLGYVHGVTAPFELRNITKNAWQIMSEELGDGDLAKNHAHVFYELLKGLGVEVPRAHDVDFIRRPELNSLGGWKSAVSQLLISLFPHDFLPEILGFNLHFELITWDTIAATKELKEVGIDAYYFLLHVCIDNAHSGHTAMAIRVVNDYLKHVNDTEGPEALQAAWKRVQTGFILSDRVSSTGDMASAEPVHDTWNAHSAEVLRIFQEKAPVSAKLHCNSKVKIEGRSLVEWLDPEAIKSKEWSESFMEALSHSKAWVKPGDSEGSRLIKALSWTGKMFGAFSDTELVVARRWIDAIPGTKPSADKYWTHTGRDRAANEPFKPTRDILDDAPVVGNFVDKDLEQWMESVEAKKPSTPVPVNTRADMQKLLPLWFAQIKLLEPMISIPMKTCNEASAAIIRTIRAQRGFIEGEACAGIDEMLREEFTGLHELGMSMMKEAGMEQPEDLHDIFADRDENKQALKMMHLANRPMQYHDEILGMAGAFVDLHEALCSINATAILPPAQMTVLSALAQAERDGLQVGLDEIEQDAGRRDSWCRGYQAARTEIDACFTEE